MGRFKHCQQSSLINNHCPGCADRHDSWTISGRSTTCLSAVFVSAQTTAALLPWVFRFLTSISSSSGDNSTLGNSSASVPTYSNSSSADSSFCLLESQDWVGSDVIQPSCSGSNDTSCDPSNPENSRMANLYNDDLVCITQFNKRR